MPPGLSKCVLVAFVRCVFRSEYDLSITRAIYSAAKLFGMQRNLFETVVLMAHFSHIALRVGSNGELLAS